MIGGRGRATISPSQLDAGYATSVDPLVAALASRLQGAWRPALMGTPQGVVAMLPPGEKPAAMHGLPPLEKPAAFRGLPPGPKPDEFRGGVAVGAPQGVEAMMAAERAGARVSRIDVTQPLGLGEITVVLRSPEYSPAEKAMAQQQLDAMTPGGEPAAEPAPDRPAAASAAAGGPREALARYFASPPVGHPPVGHPPADLQPVGRAPADVAMPGYRRDDNADVMATLLAEAENRGIPAGEIAVRHASGGYGPAKDLSRLMRYADTDQLAQLASHPSTSRPAMAEQRFRTAFAARLSQMTLEQLLALREQALLMDDEIPVQVNRQSGGTERRQAWTGGPSVGQMIEAEIRRRQLIASLQPQSVMA